MLNCMSVRTTTTGSESTTPHCPSPQTPHSTTLVVDVELPLQAILAWPSALSTTNPWKPWLIKTRCQRACSHIRGFLHTSWTPHVLAVGGGAASLCLFYPEAVKAWKLSRKVTPYLLAYCFEERLSMMSGVLGFVLSRYLVPLQVSCSFACCRDSRLLIELLLITNFE